MPNSQLPPLPTWHARSFWLSLVMALSMIFEMAGINLAVELGFDDNNAFVDNIMVIVGAVAGLGAWQQRLSPHFQLVWHKVSGKKTYCHPLAGLAVLAVFFLAACEPGNRLIVDRPPTCEEARWGLLIASELGQDTTRAAMVLDSVCPPVE